MENAERVKYVADSQTSQVQIIMPQHLNGDDNLFGGQLAMWIDIVAGIVARRHCGRTITTAAIDNLRFHTPAAQGDLVVLRGRMTHVGKTSMEVRVDSFVEDLTGRRKLINTAFVIEVALDDAGKPVPVPALLPQTPEEEREFEAGRRRRELRLSHQKDLYN